MGLFKPSVKKLQEKSDIKRLIAILRHKNADLRDEAARALQELDDARAVGPLIEALKDEDRHVRSKSAEILGQIGDSRAIEPLVEVLGETKPGHDRPDEAAKALEQFDDTRTVQLLIGTLTHENVHARCEAAKVLGRLQAPDAVKPLIHTLQDKEWLVRATGAQALGEIGERSAREPLVELMSNETKITERIDARRETRTSGDFGSSLPSSQVFEEIVAMERQSHLQVYETAEEALGEIEEKYAQADRNGQIKYLELSHADDAERDHAFCSDDACPCGSFGVRIPRGEGYLYISHDVVEFRTDCLTVYAANKKIQPLMGGGVVVVASGVFAPILVCEMGAKERKLNLEIAAADARHWWETELVPLRATPTV